MSAFMCSPKHFYALINFSKGCGYGPLNHLKFGRDDNQIGQILVDQNAASIRARYHEGQNRFSFRPDHTVPVPELTPVEAIKLCQCLQYQSCETSDYEETDAYKIVQSIEQYAIGRLEDYDAAPWGI